MIPSSYSWKPGDGTILRISKSSLGTFGFCPKQYEFVYIEGIRDDVNDDMVRGTNVHEATGEFYNRVGEQSEAIMQMHDDGYRQRALTALIDCFPAPEEFEFRHETDRVVPIYQYGEDEPIRQLAEWELERLMSTRGEDFLPVGNEQWVSVRTTIEVDGEDIPIEMRGYIDRIFRDEAGGLALMELKTGKWKGNKVTPMRKELSVYRFMLQEKRKEDFASHCKCCDTEYPNGREWAQAHGLDDPITHVGWRFPRGGVNGGIGPHWDYEPAKKASMNAMLANMKDLIRCHINQEFRPITETSRFDFAAMLCSYCDKMAYCPAWTDGLDVGL